MNSAEGKLEAGGQQGGRRLDVSAESGQEKGTGSMPPTQDCPLPLRDSCVLEDRAEVKLFGFYSIRVLCQREPRHLLFEERKSHTLLCQSCFAYGRSSISPAVEEAVPATSCPARYYFL